MREMIDTVPCDFIEAGELAGRLRAWLSEPKPAFRHIVTMNAEMVVLAAEQSRFRAIIHQADLVVPDGAGLFWARDYLQGKLTTVWRSLLTTWQQTYTPLPGRALVQLIAAECQRAHQRIFIVGSTQKSATTAARKLERAFSGLTVLAEGGGQYDSTGPHSLIQKIEDSGATVLLVAYGAPKQAIWIDSVKQALPAIRLAVGVGGTVDQLSGRQTVAPVSWQQHNVEWLWRLSQEPQRLPRIWRATISFPKIVRAQKVKSSVEKAKK